MLAKYRGAEPELVRVQARPVRIRGEACVSFVYRYHTRDVTLNLPVLQALQRVDELLGQAFHQAHLHTAAAQVQLSFSKRGKALLRTMAAAPTVGTQEPAPADAAPGHAPGHAPAEAPADAAATPGATPSATGLAPCPTHNRGKQRPLALDRPFLQALGVTDRQHRLIPAMSRKWKQINRFIEVFEPAWKASGLGRRRQPLRLIDFGAGKGYLTFALHDYLRNSVGTALEMTGVEVRADLVQACNDAVATLGLEGLGFIQGDIAGHRVDAARPDPLDVVIALHACDTATDDAIHQGIRAKAAIIMCAPCCHQQLRPQLLSPHPLRPILRHGIHLGQEAEMLTDGLRAMLLEACGYDTQVFEFVSLEHTSKNKMILAVRRAASRDPGPVLAQIREIKSFYGIREQRLESLLRAEGSLADGLQPEDLPA